MSYHDTIPNNRPSLLKRKLSQDKPMILGHDRALPMEIDRDLINSLRLQGKRTEADNLLKAYQESLKQSWKQGRKENKKIASLANRARQRKLKLCYDCNKPLDNEPHKTCKACMEKRRIANRKLLIKRNSDKEI